jgi:hypothetical protein
MRARSFVHRQQTRDWLRKIMRNGWTGTAGEDFIAIASNKSVIDPLSKDETVPSAVARLSGRFVCPSRSQSISIAHSGPITAYKNTEAHPNPACQQLCDQCEKGAPIWLYASLDSEP